VLNAIRFYNSSTTGEPSTQRRFILTVTDAKSATSNTTTLNLFLDSNI
jgi:hypothetical protein